jgi:hypothetical protein
MKYLPILLLMLSAIDSRMVAQTNNIIVTFDHTVGNTPLKLDQTVFPIWNNKNVKITRAQFYLSELEIHQADGSTTLLTDQYLLVSASGSNATYNLGNWPVDGAHGVTLHLGVPPSVNHLDPTTYPPDHALATQNPTMHWGWASGYRFLAIEGKVDDDGDGEPETPFAFHNLGDALYRSLELSGTKEAENGVLQLHFVVDYVALFKNMSMTGNLEQHGSEAINAAMMDNAATPAFISMFGATATNEVLANSANISAAPNPFSTETMIHYALPAVNPMSLQVTNALGQVVYSLEGLPTNGAIRFEKGGLPTGLYQYAFYENGSLLARKKLIINE